MATLAWTDITPNAVILPTLRKYYGEYLYRAKVHVKHVRYAKSRYSKDIINFEKRMMNYRYKTADMNIQLLHDVVSAARSASKVDATYRVIEPNVIIYAKTEEELLKFIQFTPRIREHITELNLPANQDSIDALLADKIIIAKDNGFKYKMSFKEGRYKKEVMQQLHDYFETVPDEIRMSSGAKKRLISNYTWIDNHHYIMFNDEQILFFVKLICPAIIGKVSEFTVISHNK